jgi:hypothetical protein
MQETSLLEKMEAVSGSGGVIWETSKKSKVFHCAAVNRLPNDSGQRWRETYGC